MSVEEKDQETIQARVADFAQRLPNSDPHDNDLRARIFADMGRLASEPAADREYNVEDKHWDDTGNFVLFKVGRLAVVSATDWQHLHEHDDPDGPEIQMRVKYLQAYAEFDEQVDQILAERSKPAEETDGDEQEPEGVKIAVGGYATAISFKHNEKEYVLKITHDAATSALQSDDRILGLAAGSGMPHLEQIAALSYIKGVVITERLPGADFSRLPLETASQITDTQLKEAIKTMRAAHEAGIKFDGRAPNFLYDPEAGFGFIDYETNNGTEFQTFTDKIIDFAMALTNVEIDDFPETHQDYVAMAQRYEGRILLLEQYRDVCIAELSQEEDNAEVVETINGFITGMRQFVTDVRTPGWIDAQFAEYEPPTNTSTHIDVI